MFQWLAQLKQAKTIAILCMVCIIQYVGNAIAQDTFLSNNNFLTGFDANYSLDMMENKKEWKIDGKNIELFKALRKVGGNSFRVRIWTNDTGQCGKIHACKIAKNAQDAGLYPYLVFFLSENWSDYVKQPAPSAWQNISFKEKEKKVFHYTSETAEYFKKAGVSTDLYAIGNEIDFGICGEYEEKWELRFNYEYMETRIWNKAAKVILAAEKGIKSINPDAKFVLHLTQWWNPEFCEHFLKTMINNGVQVDYLGLSFYPSSGMSKKNSFRDLSDSIAVAMKNTKRPVIICEYAYPSTSSFEGQFSSWNNVASGYPLSEMGQKEWINDFLSFCRKENNIKGSFYWSPEWYSEEMWKAFALFREDGESKKSLQSFK